MAMTSRQFRVLMVLTVVSGLLGGAGSNLLLQGGPAVAQAGGAVQEVVRAKRFEVVDDQGKRRAALGLTADGSPAFWLYDATGKTRVELHVLPDGSTDLLLYDAAGERRAWLGLTPDGSPYLWLRDTAGKVIWHAP
jgi:hypothetical protein